MHRDRHPLADPSRPDADQTNPWARVITEYNAYRGDGNAAGLQTASTGFFTGGDTASGKLFGTEPAAFGSRITLGSAFGYQRLEVDALDRTSSGSVDTFHIGLYAGTRFERLAVRTGLAYGGHRIGTRRMIDVGALSGPLDATYSGGTAQVFGELGYEVAGTRFQLEPFVHAAHMVVFTGAATEAGGAAALTVSGGTTSLFEAAAGVRAMTSFALGGLQGSVDGTLAWTRGFGTASGTSTHRFAGGEDFTVRGLSPGGDVVRAEVGVRLDVSAAASFSVMYSGRVASGSPGATPSHSIQAALGVRF